MREWEYFFCEMSFGRWVVRPKDDRSFESPNAYRVNTKELAIQLCEKMNKQELVKKKTHNRTPLDQLIKYPEDL